MALDVLASSCVIMISIPIEEHKYIKTPLDHHRLMPRVSYTRFKHILNEANVFLFVKQHLYAELQGVHMHINYS